VNSGSPEGLAVDAPLVTPIMLTFKRHQHHVTWKSC
jgi:hypothetical protein